MDERTVVLDSAFGATINWNSLSAVAYINRKTTLRKAGKSCLRLTPGWFLIGLVTVVTAPKTLQGVNPGAAIGGIFFAFALAMLLSSPYLLLTFYQGKFRRRQAWFFGIESAVDLGAIEKNLFGYSHGRLKWSTNGSMLSRHRLVNGEREHCLQMTVINAAPLERDTLHGCGHIYHDSDDVLGLSVLQW